MGPSVRWNALDPNDEGSALIVPQEDLRSLQSERDRLREKDENLRGMVSAQAHDEGLWFFAETAAEAYLQQELRALHEAVEADE